MYHFLVHGLVLAHYHSCDGSTQSAVRVSMVSGDIEYKELGNIDSQEKIKYLSLK